MDVHARIKHEPDFDQFRKALLRAGRPTHLPFYEHIASPRFISRRLGVPDVTALRGEAYWKAYVDFWMGMGFDCVPMEIPLDCPLPEGHHGESEQSEARACIRTREDFEQYPWPDPDAFDLRPFEIVAGLLPQGARIVGGVAMGPYEWAATMMGTVGMSYALADDPDLVGDVFGAIGALHVAADRKLARLDAVGALRQGDDLGFKTSTFLPPDRLRELVFPTYRRMAEAAHAADKPFILHSCGNLAEVYDDIVDGCGIDAKHSFEDQILPVEDFKRQYGDRVTPLGGLDVDVICRADEAELRAYTRRRIEACFAADGWWALGTGNSLTDYMPVEHYLVVLDEGRKATG